MRSWLTLEATTVTPYDELAGLLTKEVTINDLYQIIHGVLEANVETGSEKRREYES